MNRDILTKCVMKESSLDDLKSFIEYLIETLHALHQLFEVVDAKAYVAMNT